jgi:hypothetical protein
MHPILTYDLAKARVTDLHREADHYRLLHQLKPPATSRLRASVGQGLINMGERLTLRGVAGPARLGHQLS